MLGLLTFKANEHVGFESVIKAMSVTGHFSGIKHNTYIMHMTTVFLLQRDDFDLFA